MNFDDREAGGMTVEDALSVPDAEHFLIQKQKKWESHVSQLVQSIELLAKEEEGTAEANEDMIGSVLKLRQLNTALASAAKRQRDQDANHIKHTQATLEMKLIDANRIISERDSEIKRLQKQLGSTEETVRRQEKELVGLRGIVQSLQRNEKSIQEDLESMSIRARKAEERARKLHSENVALNLEKDSVTQRFLQLTRNLSVAAQGQTLLVGDTHHRTDVDRGTTGNADHSSKPIDRRSKGSKSPSRAGKRGPSKEALRWSVAQVGEWLDANGFHSHAPSFARNSVDGEMLFDLTDGDLRSILGIADEAQRQAFLCLRNAL